MLIRISLQDDAPIYRQIVNQVTYLIASRQLRPDDELPPIRTLASQLKVTPNTVVKAYGELEASSLVYKRRGAGTFVSDTGAALNRTEQKRILSERIDSLLAEAERLGFAFEPLQELIQARRDRMNRLADRNSSQD